MGVYTDDVLRSRRDLSNFIEALTGQNYLVQFEGPRWPYYNPTWYWYVFILHLF